MKKATKVATSPKVVVHFRSGRRSTGYGYGV